MENRDTLAGLALLDAAERQSRRVSFWRRLQRGRLVTPAIVILGVLVAAAALAPVIAPFDPIVLDLDSILAPPGTPYLLGTDELGRDILSRLIWSARPALLVSVFAVTLSTAIGLPIGLTAGYLGGKTDGLLMRAMDSLQAFPALVLALAITAVMGPSLTTVTVAIGVVFSPTYARLVRGQVLAVREFEFITAARATGVRGLRIAVRHILPQVISPVIVQWALGLSFAILTEASLSFLGLGQAPPEPSWGSMLRTGSGFLTHAPWMSVVPGLAILITVLGFNFLGDAVRDALDPRMQN